MKKLLAISLFTFTFSLFTSLCEAQIITTIAGNGTNGYSGDGGQATLAEIGGSGGNVLFDHAGNIYFCDQNNVRIRKVNTSGVISTFAGNGVTGFSGDGGLATAAEFSENTVITFDSSQNMYVVDFGNNRIRKINTSGIINTFAGNGNQSYGGDGGPATAAALNWPCCAITDDTGNVYIADSWNNIIRKVNTSGTITLYAGNVMQGFSGDGGPALQAEMNKPFRIAFDKQWNMYVADAFNNVIREINISGTITTVAGNTAQGFYGDGLQATNAELSSPYGVCVDDTGNIYIADTQNNRVRKVNTSGIISTIAGNGTASYSGDGGTATAAELDYPTGLDINYKGNLFIDDYYNSRVRKITLNTLEGTDAIADKSEMQIYPNPSKGVFTFEMKNEKVGMKNVEVYNTLGEEVYSQPVICNSQFVIDLSNQPNGVYLYRVTTNNGESIGEGKLVISK